MGADSKSELPLAFIAAPANENEKKHAYNLLDKNLQATRGRTERLVADTQYSSERFREEAADCSVEAVIPYPTNQHPREKGLLRVDKLFHVHGPKRQVKLYHKRSADERSNAWLKGFYGLNQLQTRGLENATIHVTLCVMVSYIIAIAALKHKRPDLIRSPTLPTKYTHKS